MEPTEQQLKAYNALNHALEQICANSYKEQLNARKGKKKLKQINHPPIVKEFTTAMSDVLSGKITVDEAMGMLHTYDCDKARFG